MLEVIIAAMLIITTFFMWRISYQLVRMNEELYSIGKELYDIWDIWTE